MREPDAPATVSWLDEEEEPPKAFSPVRAFVFFLIVVAFLMGAGLLATSDDDSVPKDQFIPETKNFALTNAEAIERFKELDHVSEMAYKNRDESLITAYTTAESPLRKSGYADIRQLREDEVFFDPRSHTESLLVLQNDSDQIVIRQAVIQNPTFREESGKNVSQFQGRLELTIDWILHREHSVWKIYDSVLVKEGTP
jgi:hypothetical protein